MTVGSFDVAQIKANGIDLEYDTFGDPGQRPLLLIMGLGTQMTRWRETFCQGLVDAGHYVIRYDNRDVGLSQKFDEHGAPDMAALFAAGMAGDPIPAAYTLADMAHDAAGLLDALEIQSAHVCGASMGGMIAQMLAIHHPTRLLSMTSIMSSTGNPELPPSSPEATAALLSPAGETMDEVLDRAVHINRTIGSPAYPEAEEDIRRRSQADFERSFHPVGVVRQMAAIAASGNRKPELANVTTPTLVLHGADDPLVPLAGGVDTHEAIKGSVLEVIDGMGHDLPEAVWPQVIDLLSSHTAKHHPV